MAPPSPHLVADSVFSKVAGPRKQAISLEALSDYLVGRGDMPLHNVQEIFAKLDTNADGTISREEWRAGFTAGTLNQQMFAPAGSPTLVPLKEAGFPTRRQLMGAICVLAVLLATAIGLFAWAWTLSRSGATGSGTSSGTAAGPSGTPPPHPCGDVAAEFLNDGSKVGRKFAIPSDPAAFDSTRLRQMVDDAESLMCGNISTLTHAIVSACKALKVLTHDDRINTTHTDLMKGSGWDSLTPELEAMHLCVDLFRDKMVEDRCVFPPWTPAKAPLNDDGTLYDWLYCGHTWVNVGTAVPPGGGRNLNPDFSTYAYPDYLGSSNSYGKAEFEALLDDLDSYRTRYGRPDLTTRVFQIDHSTSYLAAQQPAATGLWKAGGFFEHLFKNSLPLKVTDYYKHTNGNYYQPSYRWSDDSDDMYGGPPTEPERSQWMDYHFFGLGVDKQRAEKEDDYPTCYKDGKAECVLPCYDKGADFEFFERIMRPGVFCENSTLVALRENPAGFRGYLTSVGTFYRTAPVLLSVSGGCS